MSDFSEATQAINEELACSSCGAILKFKPGTHHLVCEYCGAKNEIAKPEATGEVREIGLDEWLEKNFDVEEKIEVAVVRCESCGATSTLNPGISSDKCPFCASVPCSQEWNDGQHAQTSVRSAVWHRRE